MSRRASLTLSLPSAKFSLKNHETLTEAPPAPSLSPRQYHPAETSTATSHSITTDALASLLFHTLCMLVSCVCSCWLIRLDRRPITHSDHAEYSSFVDQCCWHRCAKWRNIFSPALITSVILYIIPLRALQRLNGNLNNTRTRDPEYLSPLVQRRWCCDN